MKWIFLEIGECVLCVSWFMCLMCSMIFVCDCCWPHLDTVVHQIQIKREKERIMKSNQRLQFPHAQPHSFQSISPPPPQLEASPKTQKGRSNMVQSQNIYMTWVLSNAMHSPAISIKRCLKMSYQPNLQLFSSPPSRVCGASGEAPGGTNDKYSGLRGISQDAEYWQANQRYELAQLTVQSAEVHVLLHMLQFTSFEFTCAFYGTYKYGIKIVCPNK